MADQDFTLTYEYLHELFEYRDGDIYRKKSVSSLGRAYKKAGCLGKSGYLQTVINKKHYSNHRLIFLMHHGYLPVSPKMVDHINGNKLDNRIENLRESTRSQNAMNCKIRKTNTTGYKNVYWAKARNKWQVSVKVEGKNKHIGFFDDINLAKLAAQEARNKYYGEFANSKM